MKSAYCPTCRRVFDAENSPAMPFCSVRCRDVDLGRWLEERNTIPCDPESAAETETANADEESQSK